MRPPEFTGGNHLRSVAEEDAVRRCFNEAAGIHRRKRHVLPGRARRGWCGHASMRPPEFTGGNQNRDGRNHVRRVGRFNEAAGIHRRKLAGADVGGERSNDASMRPPEFTGGNPAVEIGRAGQKRVRHGALQ